MMEAVSLIPLNLTLFALPIPFQVGMYKVHPPMPSSLSAEAQAFLLRTFEADPHLRASAQALLGDPFLQPGKRSCRPGSPRCAPRPSGTTSVKGGNTGEDRGAVEVDRLTDLSLSQIPPLPAPLLQLTRPPSPRHSRALRHPLSTRPAPRSVVSATGAPASSGERQGSLEWIPCLGFCP